MFFSFFLLVLFQTEKSESSHFRGGTISWAPVNPNVKFPISQVEVAITTRFFWSIASQPQCDTSAEVLAGNLIGDNTAITPLTGPTWSINSQTNCKDFSLTDQWSEGVRTQIVNVTTSMEVVSNYTSCCWITGITSVSMSTSWSLPFTINVKIRTDTHRINSSPMTSINSYIKLSTGCSNNQSLVIPVTDADGDYVKCRCFNNICLTSLLIDQNKCIIYFNPTVTGYFTIEIVLEDFDKFSSTVPLSSIPLQFIAFVQANTAQCCKLFLNFSK